MTAAGPGDATSSPEEADLTRTYVLVLVVEVVVILALYWLSKAFS